LLVAFRIVVAALMVIGLPVLVQAQVNGRDPYGRNPYGRQQIPAQPVEIHGTIQGVARGGIMVLDSNTQTTWRIAILPATKVQVTGTATADSLRTGLVLEFTAEIDAKGTIREKVGELTITSLTPQKQIGLFPSGEVAAGDDQGGLGGANGDAPKGKGGKAAKPDKRTPRTRGKTGAIAAGNYRIVGHLLVGRGGALSIQPGRGTLPFQLADDATINVEMADFSAVKQGNEVSVKGIMAPNRPGVAQAQLVKVTLPEPAGGVKKKPAAKPEDKHPPQGPKKGPDKEKNPGLPEPPPEK
jgi:hypothetical protein